MARTILLDPSLMWIVDGSENEGDALTYVERANDWLAQRSSGIRRLAVNQGSVQALCDIGAFPSEPYFRETLERLGLAGVVGPRQLATAVAKFISAADCMEKEAPYKLALFNNKSVEPDLYENFGRADMREVSLDSTAMLATNNSFGSNYLLSVRSDCGLETIDVSADVVASDPNDIEERTIAKSIDIICKSSDFFLRQNAIELWKSAKSSEEYKFCIALKAAEIDLNSPKNVDEMQVILDRFVIGDNFLESLCNNEAAGDGEFSSTVLHKCAHLVSISKNVEIRDFRVNAKKHSAVRTRSTDKAKAKRIHVTDAKRGLRLMFWERLDGLIELANIGNKFEEMIVD